MENKWNKGGFGKRVKKSEEFPEGWQECSFDDVVIDHNKKTILYFDGNGGITAKTANFGAKFIEEMIGKASESGYDLFSFYYGHEDDHETGEFSEEENDKIFNTFIKPMLYDEKQKLLPEEEIENNLQNLRIHAYCMGMVETNILLNKANDVLSENFGNVKSKNLLENVFIVSYAPFNEPKFGSNVEFKSLQDDKTKEPWFVSKHASDFDALYTGLAQIEFNKDKNGLEVFSNTFNAFGINEDPHNMGRFLKENGIVSKNNVLVDKEGNRIYSRQQTISDLIGLSLAYGVLKDKPDLKEIKRILNTQLKQDEKNFFEQEQKKVFEEIAQGGRPFLTVLEESGFSLSDVYAGKVKKENLKIPNSGVKNDCKESEAVLRGYVSKPYSKNILASPKDNRYGNGLAIYCEQVYMHKGDGGMKFAFEVLKNGGSTGFKSNKDLASVHMAGEDLKDSIVMETFVQKDVNQNEKNTMTIDIGKCFKDKEYQSYDELLEGVQDSCEGNIELTPEQTRVILNEAIAARIPFSNIELKNGITFNKDVLEKEVEFDSNELICSTKITKTQTKNEDGLAIG